MLRFRALSDPKAAYFYYGQTDGGLDGKGVRAEVGGKGAELLGLSNEPDFEQFKNLLQGLHPNTGDQLTAKLIEGRIAGWDITASVPKGVTVLIENGDERVHEALWQAGREAMADLEERVTTRVRKSGQHDDRIAGNLIYFGFEHAETRPTRADGMPDPDRHIHFVVPNLTFDEREAQWKAIKFRPLMDDRKFYDRRFDLRLSRKLAELGYGIETKYRAAERGGNRYFTWDVKGVPQTVVSKFSRRTGEVDVAERAALEAIEQRDPVKAPEKLSAVARDKLGATSRQAKREDMTVEGFRAYWTSRMTPEENRQIAEAIAAARDGANPKPVNAAAKAVRYAVEHVFERRSVVAWKELAITAMERAMGGATPGEILSEAKRQGVLVKDGEATTKEVLAEEGRIIAFARDGRGAVKPLGNSWEGAAQAVSPDDSAKLLREKRAFAQLSDDQQAAVRHIQSSNDRVIMIEGDAGAGKTEAMKVTIPGIAAPGVFLAPSASASRGTLREKGFANADTIAKFLANAEFREQARNGYVYIDEAPLAGLKEMDRVFSYAKELNAKIIVQGDRKQHASVSRGSLFEILDMYAGLKVARLTKNFRQQNEEYKAAVNDLAKGDMAAGFDRLDDLGWVKQGRETLVSDYMAGRDAGNTVLVVSPTHSEGQAISDAIRAELKERGEIGREDRAFSTLKPLNWTDAQKGDLEHQYDGTEVLQFHRNSGDFKAGQRLRIADWKPGQRLGNPANFSAYAPAKLEIAPGDTIRITANGKSKDGRRIDNGTLQTVKGFTREGDIALDGGAVLPKDFMHLDHGYASTSHASQGKTVDRVLIAMGSESQRAVNAEQFYVSVSRGRLGATVYSDMGADALREAIRRSEPRRSATELMGRPKPSRMSLTNLVKHRYLLLREKVQSLILARKGTAMKDSFNEMLRTKPRHEPEVEPDEGQKDVGSCAWSFRQAQLALDIEVGPKPVQSFQYVYLSARSEFHPGHFIIQFREGNETFTITVRGRGLRPIFDRINEHRIRRIRTVDRDFGEDNQPTVTGVEIVRKEA